MKQFLSNKYWLKASKAMFVLALAGMSLSAQAQTGSKEYAVADVAALLTDMEANTYEEYILSESGTYDIYDIDISTSFTLKAKDGLSAKPVIKTEDALTNAYITIIDPVGAITATIQGVKFDAQTTGAEILGVVRIDQANMKVIMDDCEIANFTAGNGFIRFQGAGADITLKNSWVHDCMRGIRVDAGDVGDILLENSTFTNMSETAMVHWNGFSAGSANSIVANQCTVHSSNQLAKFGKVTSGITFTNCVFDAITKSVALYGGDAAAVPAVPATTATIDYCYSGFGDDVSVLDPDITFTNAITTAPIYVDAANMDITLTNASSLKGKDGTTTIGDSRWVDISTALVANGLDELLTVYTSNGTVAVDLKQLTADIMLFNISGVLVNMKQNSSSIVSFNVPKGVYLVVIESEKGSVVKRVVNY